MGCAASGDTHGGRRAHARAANQGAKNSIAPQGAFGLEYSKKWVMIANTLMYRR
jgi:hypothetical protein